MVEARWAACEYEIQPDLARDIINHQHVRVMRVIATYIFRICGMRSVGQGQKDRLIEEDEEKRTKSHKKQQENTRKTGKSDEWLLLVSAQHFISIFFLAKLTRWVTMAALWKGTLHKLGQVVLPCDFTFCTFKQDVSFLCPQATMMQIQKCLYMPCQ